MNRIDEIRKELETTKETKYELENELRTLDILEEKVKKMTRELDTEKKCTDEERKHLRKCIVTRNKKTEKCYFHAWGQHYTPTNKPDGSFIGQVLGIVEHIDGQVEEVKPKSIKFEEWGDDNGSEIG